MALREKETTVRRRTLLKGIGGLTALALPGVSFSREKNLRVGVVGGGIVGAATAYYMAKAGMQVTLFEKTEPSSGATGKSFALISAHAAGLGNPDYESLRFQSLLAYQTIDNVLDLGIYWGGSIKWTSVNRGAELFRSTADKFKGFGLSMIDKASFDRLAPDYVADEFNAGLYSGLDGHIDPVRATRQFLKAAEAFGAQIVFPCQVNRLQHSGGQFVGVDTDKGYYCLDKIVIASGVDTPALSAQAGFEAPLVHAPGLLAHSKPAKLFMGPVRVISGGSNEFVGFKQYADGRVVATEAASPPDIAVHQAIRRGQTEMPEAIRKMHGNRILEKLSRVLPNAGQLSLDKVTLGYRPKPKDGLPIVGAIPNNPNVYIAVMHSGVTLAPIMGRYISHEIQKNTLVSELSPFRPDRFL